MGVPTITSVSPAGGPTAGGQQVTIIGSNLLNATVTIGGVTATVNNVALDGTSLTCTTDAKIKDIAVTTSAGTATIVTVDTSLDIFNTATAFIDNINAMMAVLNEQVTNLAIQINVPTIQCQITFSTITLTIHPRNERTVSSIYDDLLNGGMVISINDKPQQVTSSNVTLNADSLTFTSNVTSGDYKVVVLFGSTKLLNTFVTVL
jgi:hypothetical protein